MAVGRNDGLLLRRFLLLGFAATATPARAAPAFDYYLLSLSVAPSFCAGSPRNAGKAECRRLTADDFQRTPLTLHGLWPNRARVSVNRQPQNCDGPAFSMPDDVAAELERFMPGGPGLTRYEWRKHGTCSGLPPERFFAMALSLTRQADAAIGPALLAEPGVVRLPDLLRRVGTSEPALAAALVMNCRFARGGGDALLQEVRITLGPDFQPIPAASVGLGQNSGCPGGVGRIPQP